MRRPWIAAPVLAAVAGGAAAQGERTLASRLPAPALYVSVDVEFARRLQASFEPLADVLDVVGVARPEPRDVELVRRVCDLADGGFELMLLQNQGGGDDVLGRCNLQQASIDRVRRLLESGALLSEAGRVGDVPVYAESNGGGSFVVALAGTELYAASSAAALEKALAPVIDAGSQRSLADDPDFREMTRRLRREPGLTVFGSWAGFASALQRWVAPEAASLVQLSGFDDASAVLLSVAAGDGGLLSTVLVRRDDRAGAVDGWLALVDRSWVASLVADAPRGGLGAVTMAVDPKALRRGDAGPTLRSLYASVAGGCERIGLNLEQHLLQHLKGSAGVQWLVSRDRVGPAYVAKAKSERDAVRMFDACRRVLTARGGATVRPHQGGSDELVLRSLRSPRARPLHVGIVRDQLVIATGDGLIEEAALADRRAGDREPRPARWLGHALKQLPGGSRQQVSGVVVLDLGSLLPDASRGTAPLLRHAGYLDIRPDILRLELFSGL